MRLNNDTTRQIVGVYGRIFFFLCGKLLGLSIYGQSPFQPGAYPGSTNLNFVKTWTPSRPISIENDIINAQRTVEEVKRSTQYFDGLGRSLQSVEWQVSVDKKDVVAPIHYDAYGRESYKFLPYTELSSNDGNFKSNAFASQVSSMQQQLIGQAETFYYSQTQFENSPLNRIQKVLQPGNNWVGANRGVESKNWLNTSIDDVKKWKVDETSVFSNSSYNLQVSVASAPYAQLAVTYSWSGLPGTVSAVTKMYRTLPSGNWVTNTGSATSPSIITIPAGNYEYAIQLIFNNGNPPQTIVTFPNTINTGYSVVSSYNPGQLSKSVMVDEHGKQVIEFKDMMGRVVLKKVQLTATPDDGTGSGYSGWLCTYYIYDYYGALKLVVQPRGVELLAENSWDISVLNNVILNEQSFRYEYDSRNRLIRKKVPGAGDVYMVYDKFDRLVLSQDANLRALQKWAYTQYDALSRPVATGLLTDPSNYDNPNFHWAQSALANTYPNLAGYTTEELSRTFYDDYSWLAQNGNPFSATLVEPDASLLYTPSTTAFPYAQAITQNNLVTGMPTGSKVKVLGTANTYLFSINFYDDKNRIIQTRSQNNTNGIDNVTNQYSFSGQILTSILYHQKSGAGAQTTTIVSKMSYDHAGRLLKTEKKTANSTLNSGIMPTYWVTLSQNQYNVASQLKEKKLGSQKDAAGNYTTTPIETLTYDYNIRGWLLGMNRSYLATTGQSGSTKFAFELAYDKLTNNTGRSFTSNAQYNGNINGMAWKSDGDDVRRMYSFAYDAANRLLKGDFVQQNPDDGIWNNSKMNYSMQMGDGTNATTAYDANGNIRHMTQFGWSMGVSATTSIDKLTYGYISNSNRLKVVVDEHNVPGTTLGDFRTPTTHPQNGTKNIAGINNITDYNYDANGNLILDHNKAISSITYNHLNLPLVISVAGKGTITYTYDAAGNKLQKQTDETGATVRFNDINYTTNITTVTKYVSGFVYESKTHSHSALLSLNFTDKLQFAGHEEGRIRALYNNSAAPSTISGISYDYFIKDHLGNIRMVLTDERQQNIYPAATLEGVTFNGNTALSFEDDFYAIIPANIVPQSSATGIPVYQNNNGNPPFNNNSFSNYTANSGSIYRLNATSNLNHDKSGLGIVIKVMAGDNVSIYGKSYHKRPSGGYSGSTNAVVVSELINLFAGASIISTKGVTGSQISGQPGFPGTINALVGNQPAQSGGLPKAAINWIILDEQFKYVTGGFDMVGNAGASTAGTYKSHSINGVSIPKNGYLYVYVSNESKFNVFFDNLQVIHNRGPILEETHYYPFGLIQQGISSKAANILENKKKYNGIEFENDFDLSYYDAFFRELDPQIGRWWQIDPKTEDMEQWSPYASNYDNPITYSDPLGDEPEDGGGDPPGVLQTVKAVVTVYLESSSQTLNNTINQIGTAVNDIVTSAAGVATGVANTATFGLYPAKPVLGGMSERQMGIFDAGVIVGQIGPIFLPGPKRTPTSGSKPATVPAGNKPNVNQAPKPPEQVKPSNTAQIKGERKRAGNASGTDNPFKKLKPDPNKPGNVITKDQNGKTVSKKAPEGFWPYWNKKHGTQ